MGGQGRTETDRHPLTSFDGQTGWQQIPLDLFIKMVPFVLNESAWIVDMHFYAKTKTLQVDLSQMEPYFEIVILNSHS